MNTNNQTSTTSTALVKWDAVEAQRLINAGLSVSKEMAAVAPKGALSAMRQARKTELQKNSSFLMSQMAEQGFVLSRMGAVAERKDGRKVVNLTMETKPVVKITDEQAAEVFGCTPEQFRTALNLVRGK